MRNAGLGEKKGESKTSGRNINNLIYADDTTLMAEKEELKNLLMKEKIRVKKVGLKLNIQKTKIIASGPITSWQIDGETMETMRDFIFLGSKITADGDSSHEIKMLAPWKKNYNQPRQHMKKQRHYFAIKVPSSQSYGFSCSHVRHEPSKRLNAKEWMLLSCGVGEDSWSPLDCKEIKPVNPKGNQS